MKDKYLFRGKRIDNGEWVKGHLIHTSYEDIKAAAILEIEHNQTTGFRVYKFHTVEYKTVGQFTGLTDKNGVKIFEGDKLKYTSSNPFSLGEIRILNVSYVGGKYWCSGCKIGVSLGELISLERIEVIGNIHDNN